MKNSRILTLLISIFVIVGIKAQVTTDPTPVQIDSKDLTIFFHADQGNKGLMGLGATDKVFAHTGVITNKSTNGSDWKHVIDDWGKERSETQLTYVSTNLWKLYIGDIRSFYSITDSDETVEKLAFVFWSAGGNLQGKTASNGDIFVDVVEEGLQIVLESSLEGDVITTATSKATFTAYTTVNANISISIGGTVIATGSNTNELEATYQFTSPGNYVVTAAAETSGEKVSVSKSYTYISDAVEKAYPGNGGVPIMGTVRNTDGSVTFCIAAPQKKSVMLIGSWNDYSATTEQQMYYTDYDSGEGTFRYFWTTVGGLSNSEMYPYFYIIDGDTKVADPYSRLILDPWNDKYMITGVFPDLPEYPSSVISGVPVSVYQGNIDDYKWNIEKFKGPEPSELIIYELLLRDFTGTEGKAEGNGTVRQAMEKIDYLKTLGVNAIELLPINEFEGNQSWGYNPNFYFAIDKAYGTPEDYKAFIDLCHANGIAVILDMVFNQSAGLHPWYMMYSPVDNPFYNQTAPHAYSVLNDWNQGYPLVQQQWKDVLTYWLKEYKVDGFRFDLVKGLGLNGSYANNGSSATDAYNASRVAEMKYLQDVVLSVNPNAYCINENLAGAKEENEMAANGQLNWAVMNNAGCQFAMGYSDGSNLNPLYAPNDDGRLWGSTVSYLESHDEQRLAYKQDQWGVSGIKGVAETSCQRLGSAAAQMIMTPGAHMIWMFSELGNSQNTKATNGDNITEPKVVNWSLLDEANHKGLYENYAELIGIRKNYSDLFKESATFSMACNSNNWQTGRYLYSVMGDFEIYTLINPNTTGTLKMNVPFKQKDNSKYQVLSKSFNSNPTVNATEGTVEVPANCYVVVGSVNLSDVEDVVTDNQSSELQATGGYGEIIVNYAKYGAIIYTVDGRKAGQITDTNGSVSLSPGVYLVKSGPHSLKTIVK